MSWVSSYHRIMVSEVSKGQKWRVNPFRTLEVQEMEYTYSSKNLRNYEKKWGLLENKIQHKFVLCWRSEINVNETWSFSLPGTWWKVSTKEVDLHWRKVCSTNSMFIIRSQKIYSRAFIQVTVQHFIAKGSNVDSNLHKVVYKKEN